jgi:hypothetical protein
MVGKQQGGVVGSWEQCPLLANSNNASFQEQWKETMDEI